MTGRTAVVLGGLIAVLVLSALTEPPRPQPIRITFVSSPEKAGLLRPVVASFNQGNGNEVDGRPVIVTMQVVNSGDAETRIVSGELHPTVWSPASSLWARLLNFQSGRDLAPARNPSIVRTPLVIAMWRPMAMALGWPHRPIGVRRIMDLATSGRGWAAAGHPEFGAFKLGHTDPDVSTSGLSAVVAEYYAATGDRRGLDARAITRPDVRRRIRAVERSVVRYGDTTLSFGRQLERYGPGYASAVAMEETTLTEINRAERTAKLVAIYPADGTFFSDSPFIVPRAPWVTERQRAATGAFEKALRQAITSELADRYGFRVAGAREHYRRPQDLAEGIDPTQPARELPLPAPAVLSAIRAQWHANRRSANVILTVDTSDSMRAGGRLTAARRALLAFVNALSPRDRVGVVSYGDQPFVDAPPVRLDRAGRRRVQDAIRGLEPGGESALYDATAAAVREAQKLHDPRRINAVVLLDDGGDNRSARNESELTAAIARQAAGRREGVAVYPIAFGPNANQRVLDRIASASRGYPFAATPGTLENTYRTIASYF